jgi:hypothetical protein
MKTSKIQTGRIKGKNLNKRVREIINLTEVERAYYYRINLHKIKGNESK